MSSSPASKIVLYGHPVSGNVHKIRLALSLLNLPYEEVLVDITKPREADFLALNPLGQVPVLKDGDVVLRDSAAILVYLARKYKPSLLGNGPIEEADIQKWFSFAAYDVMTANFRLRLHYLFGLVIDHEAVLQKSHAALKVLDAHLADGRQFLELGRVTVADLAVYPYIALSVDGKLDLAPYANVTAWINRIKGQDWYVGMKSIEKP